MHVMVNEVGLCGWKYSKRLMSRGAEARPSSGPDVSQPHCSPSAKGHIQGAHKFPFWELPPFCGRFISKVNWRTMNKVDFALEVGEGAVYVCVCVRMLVCVWVRVCMCKCVYVCMRERVRVCEKKRESVCV